MHVLVVTFHLDGITEADYVRACEALAPAFAEVPGLISKTFLANRETNTYGGVYFWSDGESLEAFKRSDLANSIATHPALAGFAMQQFDVLEGPSRVTRGLIAVAA
ncbi:MAG: YdhR family protein [Chloroflexota bacterium]|nr:YdhR family protein [Chloroflexota bacterium]